jgi:hypothetical protein
LARPHHERDSISLEAIGTDYTGNCKCNYMYHKITTVPSKYTKFKFRAPFRNKIKDYHFATKKREH